MSKSIIYALDFDGVICDSAGEVAITGWKSARKIWGDMPEATPQKMIDRFRSIRPIIETSYDTILAMRLLYLEESIEAFYGDDNKIQTLLKESQTEVEALHDLFMETRNGWIDTDFAGWISMNPLFAGLATRISELGQRCPWYVITRKQDCFVKQILKANLIELSDERIFGLDGNISKIEALNRLLNVHPNETIYFVEDRLPTLLSVLNNNELKRVKPILATWGYNTTEDKKIAAEQAITLQYLENFP